MAILNKWDLVQYLMTRYKEKFNCEKITPIKLQKSLYFLYAYWGGKIRSQHLTDTSGDTLEEMVEMEFGYDEDLFDASFEAWFYGPVDKDVYAWFKNLTKEEYDKINFQRFKNVDNFVIEYIDYLIDKILNTNDFVLIDISRKEQCWKSVYKSGEKNVIDNDKIKWHSTVGAYEITL
ncbi:Panacea domain-containing protein [Thomasclavelia sp.]|uniref:Panacea domain-containing protein n=1 Tax=Thomasclavelia sp. TaxID=3025757 RepID=UPI0025FC8A36|nr:type II toxin-antitoxin system antitoxin SocA domain-containing protein [Thomasclavelia sp.]